MDKTKVENLKEYISQLPTGNITYKKINGKRYPYYQWTDKETGKQRNKIVKADELEELLYKINQRKELEKGIKDSNEKIYETKEEVEFFSSVLRGKELVEFIEPITQWKKREGYTKIKEYVYGNSSDRVFILYGLRRTGKTTLIRQIISEMDKEILAKTAFMQINNTINLVKINSDLKRLSDLGYRYLFVDEITLMDDFIECAALFSDVYATRGIKIVLSGTDSLGFVFSEDRELYDRCFLLHTTFIPYKEFENVLGLKGINEYIRYGGTMSLGGVNYNKKNMTFATKENTSEYIDNAIAHNIQHSLKNYQYGNHFRSLYELYQANELTNAINRIVEDINHRFTKEVLTKDFRSSDLSLSAKNMLKDRHEPNDILYRVDTVQITEELMKLLDIKNRPKLKIELSDAHRYEIKEYLDLLDLTVDINVVYMSDLNKKDKHTVITQPGMRYSQAEALIKTLIEDDVFRKLSLEERNTIIRRILSDIRGRMMEDIVLLETKIARPNCDVFKLVFDVGEFDMVIFDPETASCEICEIKYSEEVVSKQMRHLLDEKKCRETEHRYGTIKGKYVMYRGETKTVNNVRYINVEEYLKSL